MKDPTIDPVLGVQLNANRTDIVLIDKELNPKEWVVAVVRAKLRQIKRQWRYSRSAGIDYGKVFAPGTSRAQIQEIFRRELADVVEIKSVRASINREGEISVDWEGFKPQFSGHLDLEESIDVDGPRVEASDNLGTELRLRFSADMNPHRVPRPEDFELLGVEAGVASVSVKGRDVTITTTESADDTVEVLYAPGARPMQGQNRTTVSGFRAQLGLNKLLDYLVTEEGELFITESEENIVL